jgi:arylsulfatase A-like enzyme
VTENGALAAGSGIERGFGSYREFPPVGEPPHRAETTFAAARRWIDRHRERPFLLFVQTYETHTPYRAPPDTPPLSGPRATLAGEHRDLPLRPDWQPESYDREIRYVDGALRDFVEGLEAAGLLADALLVLFSDHGEAFLEHDYLHHGGAIHDEVLRVPLIFVGAGVAGGRRVDAPVGLVDLMPTLLELLALPPVEGVMGRSFAGLVRGASPGAEWWERPLYSEAWAEQRVELVEGRIRRVERRPPALAVRRGQRKLIRETGAGGHRYSYYELASDPGEQRDLYADRPESAADLRALLEAYARRHLRDVPARAPDDALDPEREQALRALGYLE